MRGQLSWEDYEVMPLEDNDKVALISLKPAYLEKGVTRARWGFLLGTQVSVTQGMPNFILTILLLLLKKVVTYFFFIPFSPCLKILNLLGHK